MPRIDPLKLLTCLKVLLASNGGIRSASEVKRLAGLMTKYSKKLVSKCIYIQILKCTETDLLGQFMGLGGWSLTHMWLSDGIRAENWPLVQEILELLLLCPVDVQRLRSNTSPKLVKGLCKDGGNEGVRILAAKLVEQWLKVVKGESREMPQTGSMTLPGATATTVQDTAAADAQESRLPQQIIVESEKTTSQSQSVATSTAVVSSPAPIENTVNDTNDPLQITPEQPSLEENTEEKKNNATLVYKLMIKDGKQVLAKVGEGSSPMKDVTISEQQKHSIENENGINAESVTSVSEDAKMTDEKDTDKQGDKKEEKEKESESKDNKENKDKDKSRSSKEKERHREHRSSSHHKSSSSKSSSSSSKSSSSSSSKTKSSSKSPHSSSSDGKSRDRDSDKEKDKHKSSSSSKDKHKDHRDKERSSSKDKDKDKKDSKSKDRDKEKEKSRSKEKTSDKEDVKEKEKLEQAEKDKDTLSKIAPVSVDKLGRIPKKPKDESSPSGANGLTSITIPSKKASMSIEIRKDTERPKTVKTYNSQFRSHGLTDEVPPPPSRKGLKKPTSQPVPGTSIPPSLSLKRSSSPPVLNTTKDGPIAEKKPKIDMNATPSGSTEKPGAIKLIAPKPKPSTLVESDMFMDALSASANMKKDTKKRKRRSSTTKDTTSKDGTNTGSPPQSPATPPAEKVAAPLKFYQDTLEDKDEEKLGNVEDPDRESEKNEDEDDIPLKRVKEAIDQQVQDEKDEENRKLKDEDSNEESDEPPAKRPPGPGCGPDGPPGVLMLHRRRGPKKKLTWKAPEELEEIRYFELDETERVNVTKTFVDMKQMERMNEREAFLLARKLNCEDVMTEQTSWMPLILVDDVPPHPEGNQSKEKRIQAEREQTTLKALYFNRHMIPDSPAEPDMEQYQITEPAVIPLDDITGNPDAVNDFTSMPWPDPKGSPPRGGENDFMGGVDMPFNPNQFSPFMPFGQPQWSMQPGSQGPPGGPPNGMMPGGIMAPMGGLNNMNMNMNMPPNMLMGPKPDDITPMNMNMGMMPPFAPSGPTPIANFNGPHNAGPQPFNNFGPPSNMNINNLNQPNFSPPRMDQNMNRPRGPIGAGNNRGGNWRSGGPPNQSGGNWRPQGGGGGVGGPNNWVHGNRNRICKQFQRGHCRNGNKCNFLHPTNHHRI